MTKLSDMIIPAIVGGIFIGIFSMILHLVICGIVWTVIGGIIASYLLMKKVGKIATKDSAIVGSMGGMVGAILDGIARFVIVMIPEIQIVGERFLNIMLFEWFFMCILNLFLGIIFGAVGGVISITLFRQKDKLEAMKKIEKPKKSLEKFPLSLLMAFAFYLLPGFFILFFLLFSLFTQGLQALLRALYNPWWDLLVLILLSPFMGIIIYIFSFSEKTGFLYERSTDIRRQLTVLTWTVDFVAYIVILLMFGIWR